jgi:hypothetical protein
MEDLKLLDLPKYTPAKVNGGIYEMESKKSEWL